MSIVAYYARFPKEDLELITSDPEILYSGRYQVMDIDRSWDPMTWLFSEYKRAEHSYNQLLMNWMINERRNEKNKKRNFLSKLYSRNSASKSNEDLLLEEKQKLKCLKPDLIVIGIEGRGECRIGDDHFGLGDACLFEKDELGEIIQSFNNLDIKSIALDFELMDKDGVFPVSWVEEGEDLFETYIVSNFEKLKKFYTEAFNNNLCILVWYK